jgi:hypothetical protein
LQRIETSHPICQISGWKFNDLDITVRQHLCEALYAAGRTKEAGESLLRMVKTFDEDVYMSGPIAKWVSGKFMFDNLVAVDSKLLRSFHPPMSLHSRKRG